MNVSRKILLVMGCSALATLLACGEQWSVRGDSDPVAIEAVAADIVEVDIEVKLTSSVDELECGRMQWSVSSMLDDGLIALDAPDFKVLDGETTLAANLDLDEADDGCIGRVTLALEAADTVSAALTFLASVRHSRGGQSGPDAELQVTAIWVE